MRRQRFFLLTLAVAAACSGDGPTTPVPAARGANHDRGPTLYPGSSRTADALGGKFQPVNCVPKTTAQGWALLGPAGGVLEIGTHRLIVPAGALNEQVLISGTVPEGRPFEIDLQPHGLQFKKAAGLILDASSCTDVPTIVY